MSVEMSENFGESGGKLSPNLDIVSSPDVPLVRDLPFINKSMTRLSKSLHLHLIVGLLIFGGGRRNGRKKKVKESEM